MTTIYGPVPSRRLGLSLGIDPIPLKTHATGIASIASWVGRHRWLMNAANGFRRQRSRQKLAAVLANAPPDSID